MALSEKPGKGFFHPDFFLRKKQPWLFPKKTVVITRNSLRALLDEIHLKKKEGAFETQNQFSEFSTKHSLYKKIIPPSFIEFNRTFIQLQKKIRQGVLNKGVPVFFERIEEPVSLIKLLKALLQNTSAFSSEGFLYGSWNTKGGFLGFTPEMLFSFSKNKISLMALAGTASHPGPSLFQDLKEMQEHQFVIQGLKDSLKSHVIWKQSYSMEKKFGSLKHLCTKMEGTLKTLGNFIFLCRKLHPTPALGGFPKQAAFQWLQESPEQQQRGYFGAPFGFFNGRDEGFCLMALRGVEWDSKSFRVGSGCGLVKLSILQKEWRELSLKRNQIKKFFDL